MLPDLVAQWRYSWRRGSNAATATGSVLAGLALQKAEEDGVAIDEEHNRSSHAKKPTLARTDLLYMLNWGTQWTMVSYLKK